MKKSNIETGLLSHEQASRLIQLFAKSFDTCLGQSNNDNLIHPVTWYPTLTDIHRQVVHALPPVQVATRYENEHSAPSLQLTLPESPGQKGIDAALLSQKPVQPAEETAVIKSTL